MRQIRILAMIRIRYPEIPHWLQESNFYINLSEDEVEGHIEIPAKCFRKTNSIQTIQDLAAVLSVITFWGLRQIPQSVFEFCSTHDVSIWEPICVDLLGKDMTEHKAVVLACRDPQLFTLTATLSAGLPELEIFWLSKNWSKCEGTKHSITEACRFGRLDLVQTLSKRGFSWNSFSFCAAAQYGHLEVLRYLHDGGCFYDGRAQVFAVRGGQLECMKYLLSIGSFLFESITIEFAVAAHYEFLKTTGSGYPISWVDDFSIIPPVNGYFECLLYALEKGCSIHKNACDRAAKYGLLNCLRLLHEFNAPWGADTAVAAGGGGHLDCIAYLRDHGCPFNFFAMESAAAAGHLHVLQYLDTFVTRDWDASASTAAAGDNHLHCLQFLYENRYVWSPATAARAALGGHLECLQYMLRHGVGVDEEASKNAALNGHIHCLQYLHEYNCPCSSEATASAAKNNHLDCLQYLHSNGCAWNDTTVLAAAQNGHIDCLRYAVENGCSFDESSALKAAAGAATVDCLQYLIEDRGSAVPMDGSLFREALSKARLANVNFLRHRGLHTKLVTPPVS